MTTFQTIGLIIIALLFAVTVAAGVSRAINRRAAFAWNVLWIAAAVALLRPSITVTIAHLLGIGRGADLVFYCAILAMLIGFFLVYIRMKRMDRQLTTIVRHTAIRDALEQERK